MICEICEMKEEHLSRKVLLEDPTGTSDEEFKRIINEIEKRILQLKKELL